MKVRTLTDSAGTHAIIEDPSAWMTVCLPQGASPAEGLRIRASEQRAKARAALRRAVVMMNAASVIEAESRSAAH